MYSWLKRSANPAGFLTETPKQSSRPAKGDGEGRGGQAARLAGR